jgi:hypothetical protein
MQDLWVFSFPALNSSRVGRGYRGRGFTQAQEGKSQTMFELKAENEGNVGLGALLAFGLYVLQTGFILVVADGIGRLGAFVFIVVFVPPVSQFLYIIPLYKERKGSGRPSTAYGLMGGAVFMGAAQYAIVGIATLLH